MVTPVILLPATTDVTKPFVPLTKVSVPGTVPPLHIVSVCGLPSLSLFVGSPSVMSASGVGKIVTVYVTQLAMPLSVRPLISPLAKQSSPVPESSVPFGPLLYGQIV